jgi:hypothetical protein
MQNSESSFSRNLTTSATSSGRVSRRLGIVARYSGARHGESAASRGVSAGPGAIALTRTPRPATSTARLRTSPMIAPFAAA